jgi:hypothetical protein
MWLIFSEHVMKINNSMFVQKLAFVSVLKMFKAHCINVSVNGVFFPFLPVLLVEDFIPLTVYAYL